MENKFLVHTRLGVVQGGCAQTLCARVVRSGLCVLVRAASDGCARGLCARLCAMMCTACAHGGCKALCASNGTRVYRCSKKHFSNGTRF